MARLPRARPRRASGSARRELPDLIVLDPRMPGVSGFDVADALDQDPETSSIPILVVSAKQITTEDRAKLNGCVTGIIGKAGFDVIGFPVGHIKVN